MRTNLAWIAHFKINFFFFSPFNVPAACSSDIDCETDILPICSPSKTCLGCTVNAQCTNSNNPYCISTGACVACLSDSNCSGTTPVCVDGICQGKF